MDNGVEWLKQAVEQRIFTHYELKGKEWEINKFLDSLWYLRDGETVIFHEKSTLYNGLHMMWSNQEEDFWLEKVGIIESYDAWNEHWNDKKYKFIELDRVNPWVLRDFRYDNDTDMMSRLYWGSGDWFNNCFYNWCSHNLKRN